MLPALIVLMLLLYGCQTPQVFYAPPEQQHPMEGSAALPAALMINMNDVGAGKHFVQDISPGLEGGSWRWTGKRPAIETLLGKGTGLKFVVDLTLPDVTMQSTGPVTISYFIGTRLLDKVHYEKPGYQHFEKAVPAGWLQTLEETTAAAEIDKVYIAPQDGKVLGFVLTRMGFERQ